LSKKKLEGGGRPRVDAGGMDLGCEKRRGAQRRRRAEECDEKPNAVDEK
jgi:hypothetical protein